MFILQIKAKQLQKLLKDNKIDFSIESCEIIKDYYQKEENLTFNIIDNKLKLNLYQFHWKEYNDIQSICNYYQCTENIINKKILEKNQQFKVFILTNTILVYDSN